MNTTPLRASRFDQLGITLNNLPAIPLHTLIFHVTMMCNLQCRHCWQRANLEDRHNTEDERRGIISPADFTRVLNESKDLGLGYVKFTGGEPFLHPYIMEYLDIADREKLSVVIETNGTLLDEDIIKKLKTINHLFISVSLDGATAKVHDRFRGVEGIFDQTLATLEILNRFAIPVQIIMCLHQENVQELDDMVRLAAELGAQSVKINPVQPIGRGQDFTQGGYALSVMELLQIADYCQKSLSLKFPGRLFFSLPIVFRPFTAIRDQRFAVCRILQILGLLPNGDISFCGVGNIDDSTVFGNIYKDNLAELWHKAPFLLKLREHLPHALKGVCSRCIVKTVCLGECRAMAYEQTGDLMGPYWICQEAYDAGLFPASRLIPEHSEVYG